MWRRRAHLGPSASARSSSASLLADEPERLRAGLIRLDSLHFARCLHLDVHAKSIGAREGAKKFGRVGAHAAV